MRVGLSAPADGRLLLARLMVMRTLPRASPVPVDHSGSVCDTHTRRSTYLCTAGASAMNNVLRLRQGSCGLPVRADSAPARATRPIHHIGRLSAAEESS